MRARPCPRWVPKRYALHPPSLLAATALALTGCAWSLDDARPGQPPAVDAAVPAPPTCPLTGARGRVRTVRFPDGSLRLVADELGGVAPAVVRLAAPDPAACLGALPAVGAPALDLGPLGGSQGGLLGVAAGAGSVLALIETTSGLTRTGIAAATWDDSRAVFVAAPAYLFTGDRAGFGDAVLLEGGFVYLFGCRNVGFFRDDCYVARAPEAAAADPTAYTFYRAGGSYGPDLEDAWPLFTGGRGLAVMHRGARYYALYSTPLGDTIFARSGLSPSGPWSAAVAVARCGLPRQGTFCGALTAHPELGGAADRLWLSHAIASFDPLTPAEAAPRLVEVSLAELP